MDLIEELVKDKELLDMFKAYKKLASEHVIDTVTAIDNSIIFRTSVSTSEHVSFLGFVFNKYREAFKELTGFSSYSNIWFLSIHSDYDSPYVSVWLSTNTPRRISFDSGLDFKRFLNNDIDCKLLCREVRAHLDILLTIKAMFYEEYYNLYLRNENRL